MGAADNSLRAQSIEQNIDPYGPDQQRRHDARQDERLMNQIVSDVEEDGAVTHGNIDDYDDGKSVILFKSLFVFHRDL